MLFLIETNRGRHYSDVEADIIIDLIKASQGIHKYIEVSVSDFMDMNDDLFNSEIRLKRKEDFDTEWENAIPIGTVDFVEKFFKIFKGIDHENSIEIPPVLRKERFLKRKYSIVPLWEMPREGRYFIKDATKQKVFHYKGELADYIYDEMYEAPSNPLDSSVHFDYNHLYQVSEIVNVLAEYRVYVIDGKIEQICQFGGDPLTFPDAEIIKEAIEIYGGTEDCPGSYSLDVMVTPRGTAITEIHTFFSLGLYSTIWDDNLLYAYKDAMDWVVNHNTEPTEHPRFF